MKQTMENKIGNWNAIAWLLQRLTAVGLLLFLGIHFWLLHYRHPGEVITYDSVLMRLRFQPLLLADLGLLIFGLFHALNGLQAIIQDYGFGAGGKRGLGWILLLLGLVMGLLGGFALWQTF
jgi:succinate dehydrogenase hydrophobic anchor subunit